MATSSLGSLVVELSANVARFSADMGRAAQIADRRMSEIKRSVDNVRNVIGGIAVTEYALRSFDILRDKIGTALDNAGKLKDLSEQTGASVEALSALSDVARIGGGSVDDFGAALARLSKTMVDAQTGGGQSAEALRALGISIDELKGKKPDEVFVLIAQKQALFADGAGKAAAMQALLGKSGASLLPLMNDLAESQELQASLTTAQAARADELGKSLGRLHVAQDLFWRGVAFGAIPALESFIKGVFGSDVQVKNLDKTIGDLVRDDSFGRFFDNVALDAARALDSIEQLSASISAMAAAGRVVGNLASRAGDFFKGSDYYQSEEYKAKVAETAALTKDFEEKWKRSHERTAGNEERVRAAIEARRRNEAANATSGKNGPNPPPTLPQVNFNPNIGNLATLAAEQSRQAQRDLDARLRTQEAFIGNEARLLSSREQMLRNVYNQELTNAEDYYSTRTRLEQENLASTLAAYDRQEAAVLKYLATEAKTTDERRFGVERLTEIYRRRFDAEVEGSERILDVELERQRNVRALEIGNREYIRSLDLQNEAIEFGTSLLGKSRVEVAKLTAARQIDLEVAERIRQMQRVDSSFDSSSLIEDAERRKERAMILIDEQQKRQTDAWTGAQSAVARYGEAANDAAGHIGNAMTNAFADAEDAFVRFVETGKLSFDDLARNVIANLIRMQAQAVISGFFNLLFSGGTGNFDESGSLFSATGADVRGRRAAGGPVLANEPYIVGEIGPELFVPNAAGTIVPNHRLGGGGGPAINITQNITVDSRTDAASIAEAMRHAKDAAKAEIRREISQGSRAYTRAA